MTITSLATIVSSKIMVNRVFTFAHVLTITPDNHNGRFDVFRFKHCGKFWYISNLTESI